MLSSDKPIEEVLQSEGGLDYAFDCIGSQSALDSALKSLAPWGTLCCNGYGLPGTHVKVNQMELLFGKTVLGGTQGRYKLRAADQMLVDMYCSGELPIDPLITHRIKLDDINKAMDALKSGQTIRTVIEY